MEYKTLKIFAPALSAALALSLLARRSPGGFVSNGPGGMQGGFHPGDQGMGSRGGRSSSRSASTVLLSAHSTASCFPATVSAISCAAVVSFCIR